SNRKPEKGAVMLAHRRRMALVVFLTLGAAAFESIILLQTRGDDTKETVVPKPETRQAFARAMSKIKEGMAEKDVLALLGKPDDIRTHNDPGGISTTRTKEIWCYGTNGHLTFATLGRVYIDNEG